MLKQYDSLIVAYHNGNPIRVQDIGRATDSTENEQTKRSLITPGDLSDGVFVAIFKQPGSNAVQIAADVRTKMEMVRGTLPKGIDVSLLYDKSNFIKSSVEDVETTLAMTILLVVCVVFVFLGSMRATLIPGITVPLSLIATFAVMKLCRLQSEQYIADGLIPGSGICCRRCRGGNGERGAAG